MGTLLDTTVFIELERALRGVEPATAMATVGRRLEARLGGGEEVAIAAITASELLHGAHRATPEVRGRREAFVESVLTAFPPVAFDLRCARIHAGLWAELAIRGRDVGPHDRIVAATAVALGWRVGTANVGDFELVRGLDVIELRLSEATPPA